MTGTTETNKSTQPSDTHNWQVALTGKVIAITGANRGIGFGIAQVCLANGAAAVVSLDIFEPGEEFWAEKKSQSGRLHFIHCDIASPKDITAAFDRIVADHGGRFDGLVANAGRSRHQPALAVDRMAMEDLFIINVYAAYDCAVAAAKKFIDLDVCGSIVFTSSMTAYGPNRSSACSVYGASKGALRNMTVSLATEWAKHGIRVNSVSPGFVETALTTHFKQQPDWETKMKYFGGMGRMADPRELGGAYVYLLSDSATYTTGIDIPVAGGVGAW
ncbi:hypothetical protein SEUCBS140593_001694 [Sporothrix eucalyptigena]|uniref:Uncharacterized protein n=1 Tax=Sporothrix eucalyptigena TaxID=1812306 RepID=A0ABP0B0Q0_9PEZI